MKLIADRGFSWMLVLALVLALVPLTGTAAAHSATADASPSLVIQTLDGKTFDLANERGKWVIVNFWATWCSPCIAEMPTISKFVATHHDVAAIGLAWQDTRDEVLKFAKKHPVAYPLALADVEHPPAGLAAPQGLPTTYLIAPDGRIAKHFVGPVNAKMLTQAIAAAGTKSAAARSTPAAH